MRGRSKKGRTWQTRRGRGAAELSQLGQWLGYTVGEGVDDRAHLDAASGPVGVGVFEDHMLGDARAGRDLHVLLVRERFVKALLLAFGEQAGAPVCRVRRAAESGSPLRLR